MIQRLVVNGCSYAEGYARGNGHVDLAQQLNISDAVSIARGGSANSRIIRTTLKHSYLYPDPTLYVVGITYLSRWELPIVKSGPDMHFEGRWINPQAQQWSKDTLQDKWSAKDTEQFKNLQFKSAIWADIDQTEDLMFRLVSMASDLHARGNRVVVFNQIDHRLNGKMRVPLFRLLRDNPVFVDALSWRAVPWQHEQGAPAIEDYATGAAPPPEARHIQPGHHQHLNDFLTNYIQEYKILE
jgi:hypothetical protein